MVNIILPSNRQLYTAQLDEMYRLRYQVAVEEWGWTLPTAKNGYDKDDYDHEETIYFLDYTPDGRLIGCARLTPTTRPTLLTDHFMDFCDIQEPPKGPAIYEYSRYMVTKRGTTKEEFVRSRAHLTLAVNEIALQVGISHVIYLIYKKNYAIASFVWETTPLGTPRVYEPEGKTYVAGLSKLTQKGLDLSRKYAGVTEPVSRLEMPISYSKYLQEVRPHEFV